MRLKSWQELNKSLMRSKEGIKSKRKAIQVVVVVRVKNLKKRRKRKITIQAVVKIQKKKNKIKGNFGRGVHQSNLKIRNHRNHPNRRKAKSLPKVHQNLRKKGKRILERRMAVQMTVL